MSRPRKLPEVRTLLSDADKLYVSMALSQLHKEYLSNAKDVATLLAAGSPADISVEFWVSRAQGLAETHLRVLGYAI